MGFPAELYTEKNEHLKYLKAYQSDTVHHEVIVTCRPTERQTDGRTDDKTMNNDGRTVVQSLNNNVSAHVLLTA